MNIIVCVKQVPSSNEVRLDPVRKTIIRDSSKAVANPFDVTAVEAAVQIREKRGGTVTALSMGIPATEKLLRDEIARGADKAVLLTDRAFAGADTLATSYTLSKAVNIMGGADLILCGKMATDGDTAQIGPELSAWLDMPCVTDVTEIKEVGDKYIICVRNTDAGTETVRAELPAVITVVKNLTVPRLPSVAGIRKSIKAEVKLIGAQELGADPSMTGLDGSPTQVIRTFPQEEKGEAVKIDTEKAADTVIELWEEL